MILYESLSEPVVRVGEMDLAGRRIAARGLPYATEVGPPACRFDPIDRRFRLRSPEGTVGVGPFEAQAWSRAFTRVGPGSVLIGPADAAEEIRGAYAGAARGAALAGRGVFLLDPLDAELARENDDAFVAVFVCLSAESVARTAGETLRRAPRGGVLLPLIPGWTSEPQAIEEIVEAAASWGARFVAGLVPSEEGTARRSIVEARTRLDGGAPEDFFESVHHGDWSGEIERARVRLKNACARRGLASLVRRPVGGGQPPPNAKAAGLLEERAEALAGRNEHWASLLHAAARWIDESAHDLAPIVREGNFRKIFPFGQELAREAEEALRCES